MASTVRYMRAVGIHGRYDLELEFDPDNSSSVHLCISVVIYTEEQGRREPFFLLSDCLQRSNSAS